MRERGEASMQIKTRQRVRDLAEVYTHIREVTAMLDMVPDMFPSAENPNNTDRKFLEPAAGSGNFLEEILRRKIAYVSSLRYRSAQFYEHRLLRALASIYAIDIDPENVAESKERLKHVLQSHLDNDLNTKVPTPGFAAAVNAILETNIVLVWRWGLPVGRGQPRLGRRQPRLSRDGATFQPRQLRTFCVDGLTGGRPSPEYR